ncbi:MAG: CDP-alcohol phosphatidyltransferase family protein [Eubacteriales bacterium]|nr:CDP-alcohol phosphatidyltransferase family protein [Eubacteriales bacterium]
MNKKLIGYYDYTVVLTYTGMLVAFAGILLTIHQDYLKAVICLMVAGVCDMFDGAVASTKDRDDRAKRFGIQIDSLCDLVSFCVLPAIFTYMINEQSVWIGVLCAFYVLSGLIRLAYFNVMEEDRQKETTESRKTYLGVPVTTSALLLPAVYLSYGKKICRTPRCFPVFLAVLGIGFISGVEIKKPGNIGKALIVAVGLLEVLGIFLLVKGII